MQKTVQFSLRILMLLSVFRLSAQQDFNDYKSLRAAGDIPEDFTMPVQEKVNRDIREQKTGKSMAEEKIFFEGIHYSVNELLHSGAVVYGDEVSLYVTHIADKLLEKEEALRKKLRFYTIKSNQTNAFSTYQGMIFVTTGLISQLTSEAQLAYVLSHEISHFAENHVSETFDYHQENKRNHEGIRALSKFSKENEFEADRRGLEYYHAAGYSQEELLQTFDVLLYSYLPFDEVAMPKSYLNTSLLTIPDGFFPSKKYEITAVEDADDSKSSHPNIKNRKEVVQKEIGDYTEWGSSIYLFGREKFEYIRTICRFESVRNDILDAEFDDALYSIFILEKSYPNSLYLNRMKAKAWLCFADYKINAVNSGKLPSEKDLEGEIATLQYVMKHLDKIQGLTVCLRKIEDIRKQFPKDPMIVKIHEQFLRIVINSRKLDLKKFSGKTYEIAYRDYLEKIKDTVQPKVVENTESLSKYDKIKLSKSATREVEAFDTASFYLYALTDLVADSLFLRQWGDIKEQLKQEKKEQETLNNMTYRELKQLKKDPLKLESLVYLDPVVISRNKNGNNRIKAEQIRQQCMDGVIQNAKEMDRNIKTVSFEDFASGGSEMYNRHALMMSYFSELKEVGTGELISTDYMELTREFAGDSCLAFSLFVHEKLVHVNPGMAILSIVIYPIALIYVPYILATQNSMDMTVMLVNPHSGKIIRKLNTYKRQAVNPANIKARLREFLQEYRQA